MLKSYLQREFWVELEFLDSLGPGLKLVSFRINVVVEDGACSGELDGLEVRDPPLGELHSVVHQLQEGEAKRFEYIPTRFQSKTARFQSKQQPMLQEHRLVWCPHANA